MKRCIEVLCTLLVIVGGVQAEDGGEVEGSSIIEEDTIVEEDFSGRVFVLESYEGDASGNNELSVSDVIENLNDEFETKVKI